MTPRFFISALLAGSLWAQQFSGIGQPGAVSYAGLQAGSALYCPGSGSAGAQTCSVTPSLLAYTTGQAFFFRPSSTTTGGMTLNINSLGAKSIVRADNSALQANDMVANAMYPIWYDGTSFRLIGVQAAASSYLTDPGANGLLSRTGAGTVVNRSLTGTLGRITVNNGDGVSGNPQVDVGGDVLLGTSTYSNPGWLLTLDAGKLTTGTVPTARLGSGTANNTTYLRGDQSWTTAPTPDGNLIPQWQTLSSGKWCTTAGSSTVYTCGLTPSLAGRIAPGNNYTNGMLLSVKAHAASGATPTLNIDAVGAKRLYAADGTSDPTLTLNEVALFVFDSALDSGNGGFRRASSASGGGEVNTSSNAGAGIQLAKAKVGVDLPFRTLTSTDAALTLTQNTDTVDLTAGPSMANVGVANDFTAANTVNTLYTSISRANEGTTGTTTNKLVSLTGATSAAIVTPTGATTGILGLCVSGCGTAGNARVAVSGYASCVFDGATTAGDWVQRSGTTAGNCVSAGSTYPSSGQVIGRVLSTNGGAGTYQVLLLPFTTPSSSAGALLAANNLSDLANTTTARTNLGLGNSATLNTGTTAGTVATGDHTHAGGGGVLYTSISDSACSGTATLGYGPMCTVATGSSAYLGFQLPASGVTTIDVRLGFALEGTGAVDVTLTAFCQATGATSYGTAGTPVVVNSATGPAYRATRQVTASVSFASSCTTRGFLRIQSSFGGDSYFYIPRLSY